MEITKEFLEQKYIKEKLSTRDISHISGESQTYICRSLKKYNIKARSYKENKMPTKKGEKITWDLKNQTPEINKKRSEALKGTFHPRKNGNYHPPVSVKCKVCNISFPKPYSLWNKSKTKNFYCNMDCQKAYKKGKNFNKVIHKIKCNCDYCDKQIERVKSQFNKYKNHFCSPKCKSSWTAENITGDKIYNWTGGYKSYYGPNWGIQRRACRKRDNNECQVCKKTKEELGKNMDVDHKIPARLFDDYKKANDLDNLWCLCNSCHSVKTNWQGVVGEVSMETWKLLVKDLTSNKHIWLNRECS